MKVGDVVRVVAQTDETLEDRFVGRIGVVRDADRYHACGDNPPVDPFIEVQHAQGFGSPAEVNFYWTEELAVRVR